MNTLSFERHVIKASDGAQCRQRLKVAIIDLLPGV